MDGYASLDRVGAGKIEDDDQGVKDMLEIQEALVNDQASNQVHIFDDTLRSSENFGPIMVAQTNLPEQFNNNSSQEHDSKV